jgi:hypothetical protein
VDRELELSHAVFGSPGAAEENQTLKAADLMEI